MRIYQFVIGIRDGDGVSACVLSIDTIIRNAGLLSKIATLNNGVVDSKRHEIEEVASFKDVCIKEDDIIMYHFAGPAKEISILEKLKCHKILVFHNITTPSLVRNIDWNLYKYVSVGVEEIKYTHKNFNRVICLSEYSKRDLVDNGWREDRVDVIPIVSLNEVKEEPNVKLISEYDQEKQIFLFVGRMVPNKKIQDVIKSFAEYQRKYNADAFLILVGSLAFKSYYERLQQYIEDNQIKNVVFTGKVSQTDLEAYYQLAGAYICMSEHEGFCIPILEAFQREVPVIAYAATAVPDTMGGAGVLVEEKNYAVIADKMYKICSDSDYRNTIIRNQKKRVSVFQLDNFS